jgi:uncharacterized protein (TIGR02678 family)
VALLLAEHLADRARADGAAPVGHAALHRHVAGLVARHRAHWRRDVADPGAEVALTERTLDRLEALRLVRRTEDGVVPLPALGRYALAPDDDGADDEAAMGDLWETAG